MKKTKLFISFILLAAMLFSMTFSAYAETEEVVEGDKSYEITRTWISNNKNDKSDFKEEMIIGKKKYKLKDVSYDAKELVLYRKIKTADKDKWEKTATKTIDGKTYTYTADVNSINWKTEKVTEVLNEYREYGRTEVIPDSLTVNGIVYTKADVKAGTKTENCSWPATFYSLLKSTPKATFNGKEVAINGSNPEWSGYQNDVLAYLGYSPSNAKVTGGKWTTDWQEYGDGYIRHAVYSGTRTLPIYTAQFTYTGTEGGKTINTAKVKFVSKGNYEITAVAKYERVLTTAQKIMIGAGIGLVAILIVAIIFAISRKKKKEQK